jgi:Spy/CpxP family protein refolding chaperone
MLPGVALVAQQVSAQAAQVPGAGFKPASQRVSHKVLLKYDRPKAISKVPKTEAKTAKYLNSLNALLGLTSAQQQQAAAIFAAAVTVRTAIRGNMKVARQGLTTAIKNNDSAGISQLSASLGNLTGQHTAAGASANAAFYQILTADQQKQLTQIKS